VQTMCIAIQPTHGNMGMMNNFEHGNSGISEVDSS
jgi:hypothetical protein